jgi:hypothetical protein
MHSDTRIQAEKQMKSVQNQLKIIDEKYLAWKARSFDRYGQRKQIIRLAVGITWNSKLGESLFMPYGYGKDLRWAVEQFITIAGEDQKNEKQNIRMIWMKWLLMPWQFCIFVAAISATGLKIKSCYLMFSVIHYCNNQLGEMSGNNILDKCDLFENVRNDFGTIIWYPWSHGASSRPQWVSFGAITLDFFCGSKLIAIVL